MKEFVDFSNKFKPEGKVKVELFDDLTGRKVEEIETNNFISKGAEYYFKILMKNLFTKDLADNLAINHSPDNMFGRIILTNASHPEQPKKEWLFRGEVIGWASTTTTYSGSDELRGTINTGESFVDEVQGQVHFVFDFPTHAANGTFQSIYFAPHDSPSNFGIFRPFVLDNLPGVLKVQKYNNEIWVLHSKGVDTSWYDEQSSNIISRYNLNYNLIQTYTLPYEKRDFYIHNNYIYYAEGTWSRGIQRAPLSNPTNLTTVIDDLSTAGIVFDHKKNHFVTSHSSDVTGDRSVVSYIRRFDTDFNLLSNTEYVFPDGGAYYQKMTITDDGDIFVNGRNRSYVLQNDKAEFGAGIGFVTGFFDDYKVMRNGEVMPKTGIGSRALLDAPVTKTSSTTMKITYDFMLPSLM